MICACDCDRERQREGERHRNRGRERERELLLICLLFVCHLLHVTDEPQQLLGGSRARLVLEGAFKGSCTTESADRQRDGQRRE